jgi:hypothetical protein
MKITSKGTIRVYEEKEHKHDAKNNEKDKKTKSKTNVGTGQYIVSTVYV